MSNYERWEDDMGKTFDDVLVRTLRDVLWRVTEGLYVAAERLLADGEGDDMLADFGEWARDLIDDEDMVREAANRRVELISFEDVVWLTAALRESVPLVYDMGRVTPGYERQALELAAANAIVDGYGEPTIASAIEEAERMTLEALEEAGE